MNEFGKTLLEFRAKHNLTQKQMSEILCVGKNAVSRYELGENEPTAVHRIMYEIKMTNYERKNENGRK